MEPSRLRKSRAVVAAAGLVAAARRALPQNNLAIPTPISPPCRKVPIWDSAAATRRRSPASARQVGPTGRVIGVDMTPEMIDRAKANAAKIGLAYVDFRLGEIEHLPVEDNSIDVIMSNCVINLAPDKPTVFREAFRVLTPGGRLAISDVVAIGDIPAAIAADPAAYTGCVAGAAPVAELERMIAAAGFHDVRVAVQAQSRTFIEEWSPGSGAEPFVASALIEAVKPA
jgi:arsenite methyltransferase